MQDQGVGVLRTKKGLLLRLPDGSSTAVHFTNSDVRAKDNLIARLRRAGVRHPDDRKDIAALPLNITSGSVAPATKRRIQEAVAGMNYPDSVQVQRLRELTGLEHITVSKGLYALGFTPTLGKGNSRDWMTPPDMLDRRTTEPEHEPEPEPESPTLPDEPEPDRPMPMEPQRFSAGRDFVDFPDVSSNGHGDPATIQVQQSSGREFIDSHDSWVVDLTGVPKAVSRYMQVLRAAGLSAEIRVWRDREGAIL
jgi:hypothetical protein